MSRQVAARAVTALAEGNPDEAAAVINVLHHRHAIASLLEVAALTARFAAQETGIPTETLLTTIGEHP